MRPPAPRPSRFAWRWPPLAGWVGALLGVSVLVLALTGRVLVPPAAALTGPPASAPTAQVAATPAPAATMARQPTGQASITVSPQQTFADVAARLGWSPGELAAYLGRETVTAGETITRPLYDGATPPPLERAPAQARVVATVVPTAAPGAAPGAAALGCAACGGGSDGPRYDDPGIASGGSIGGSFPTPALYEEARGRWQAVTGPEGGPPPPTPVQSTYDDPAIESGASIGGEPAVQPPVPPSAWATPGLNTPYHNDPAITSGGSIGGSGP